MKILFKILLLTAFIFSLASLDAMEDSQSLCGQNTLNRHKLENNIENIVTPTAASLNQQPDQTVDNIDQQTAENNNHIIHNGVLCVIHDNQSRQQKALFVPKEMWLTIISFLIGDASTQDFKHVNIADCNQLANANKWLRKTLQTLIYPTIITPECSWNNKLFVIAALNNALENASTKPIKYMCADTKIYSFITYDVIINILKNAVVYNQVVVVEGVLNYQKLRRFFNIRNNYRILTTAVINNCHGMVKTFLNNPQTVLQIDSLGVTSAFGAAAKNGNVLIAQEILNHPTLAHLILNAQYEHFISNPEVNNDIKRLIQEHLDKNNWHCQKPCSVQ